MKITLFWLRYTLVKLLKLIFILFSFFILFLSFSLHAQKKMAKIDGFNGHQIEVNDTVSENTLNRFVFYMNSNPINYEKALRTVKGIRTVDENRYYVSDFKDGVIWLNNRLDSFPATKEIVILHHLAVNTGMQSENSSRPHVKNTAFNITDRNEEMFQRQLAGKTPYEFIVKKLIERSPLKSKL